MSKLGLVRVETWSNAPMFRCALCRTTATKADAMFRHLVSAHHVNPIMALIETRPDPAPEDQEVGKQAGSPDSESSAPETPAESEHAT